LQAAIAALHAEAATPKATDWREIALLYGELARLSPSPVVALNQAVAVAMSEGYARGLEMIDELARSSGQMEKYYLLHAARADLLRRMGSNQAATEAYHHAVALATNPVEQAFLRRRIEELSPPGA
jgi:RNA polymerase sigma-70 factor (ECF subfamily)